MICRPLISKFIELSLKNADDIAFTTPTINSALIKLKSSTTDVKAKAKAIHDTCVLLKANAYLSESEELLAREVDSLFTRLENDELVTTPFTQNQYLLTKELENSSELTTFITNENTRITTKLGQKNENHSSANQPTVFFDTYTEKKLQTKTAFQILASLQKEIMTTNWHAGNIRGRAIYDETKTKYLNTVDKDMIPILDAIEEAYLSVEKQKKCSPNDTQTIDTIWLAAHQKVMALGQQAAKYQPTTLFCIPVSSQSPKVKAFFANFKSGPAKYMAFANSFTDTSATGPGNEIELSKDSDNKYVSKFYRP